MKYKRLLAVLAKIALLISFIFHSGAIDYFAASQKEEASPEKIRELNAFVQIKIEKAEKDPEYKAEQYFNDLIEIENIFLSIHTPELFKLQEISSRNSSHEERSKAAQDYKEFIDPGNKAREEFISSLHNLGFKGVVSNVKDAYLYFLPWFFTLFLIWALEGSEKKRSFFRSPLSFLLAVGLYPIVLLIIVKYWIELANDQMREIRITTELRRRKERIFSSLSEDEVAIIRNYVQNKLSIKLWRENNQDLGVIRHSFTMAFLATVILIIAVKPIQVIDNVIAQDVGYECTNLPGKGPPILNLSDIVEKNIFYHYDSKPEDEEREDLLGKFCIIFLDEIFNRRIQANYLIESPNELKSFVIEIDHIPDTLNFLSLTNKNCQNSKKQKNEKLKKYIISSIGSDPYRCISFI